MKPDDLEDEFELTKKTASELESLIWWAFCTGSAATIVGVLILSYLWNRFVQP